MNYIAGNTSITGYIASYFNMKTDYNSADKINSISEVHRVLGLSKPLHPLVSLINNTNGQIPTEKLPYSHVLNFYKISYSNNTSGKLKYGQGHYDFDEGSLLCVAPGQLIGRHDDSRGHSGYTLLIHPDFLLGYPLAKKIGQYGFFSYATNEALHLSDQEKAIMISVFKIIEDELNSRIDDFSQEVMVAQIELLLTYANRFYKRQFVTRKAINNDLLQKLEKMLNDHLNSETLLRQGVPTVQFLADGLYISSSYLSDVLRSLTGQNAQQLIHHKLVEKAKAILSTSNMSVAEIAYQLGFEHPQSFSRLFKIKTKYSPLEFRRSFN